MRSVAALLLLAILAAGCGSAAPAGLDGRTFLSTAVTDAGASRDLEPGTRVRLGFADGRISVAAGCNTMGAAYRIDGGRLRITDAATTEMGCDPARQAQDDWVFAFLGSGPTVALAGDELTLTSGDSSIGLLDREVADPDRPLVGTTWTVVSIVSGDAVSSVPQGVVATLAFSADGRVVIATGCNSGGGSYVADATTLRFSDMVMTKMACDGAAGQMEAAMLELLGADRVAYGIDAARLSLRAGASGLDLAGS